MIIKALRFAYKKHKGQKRDDGKSVFWFHIVPVFLTVLLHTRDRDTLCGAILHDTIEDTDTKYAEIWRNFNGYIADIVWSLTQEGDKKRGFYFPRLTIENSQNISVISIIEVYKKAVIIKFADRLCNLSHMGCWDEKRQKHYLNKSKFWKTEQNS